MSGGQSSFDGKVEVNYDGEWGTVCNDKFDMADANVVCHMLGSGSAINISNAEAGKDVQPIWLDDLLCTGNEATLLECLHAGFGNTNCRHNEDVAVFCNEPGMVGVAIQSTKKIVGTLTQLSPKYHPFIHSPFPIIQCWVISSAAEDITPTNIDLANRGTFARLQPKCVNIFFADCRSGFPNLGVGIAREHGSQSGGRGRGT